LLRLRRIDAVGKPPRPVARDLPTAFFHFEDPIMSMPQSDRPVVVITGASSGIGRATAHAYARDGAQLVLAARGRDALDVVQSECVRLGAEALAVPTDVTDAKAVQALADAALSRFGRIDVWINNVGVGAVGRFDEVPLDAHRRVIETNLLGHMHGAYAVLPHFRRRRRGTLINMISVGGWASAPYAAAYTASKFGLRGFSESLRAELSSFSNVHVCEVYPTFVDTPGVSHGANYTGKRLRPPPPLVDPRTVAETLLSLGKAPRPSVSIGSVAWPARIAHTVAPDLVARASAWMADIALRRAKPAPISDGNLFAPSQGNAIDGGFREANDGSNAGKVLAAVAVVGLAWYWRNRGGSAR
jgi:NAD(P)-dependent dehydrogenase (short-subunit alcohol dehydrogenase family)